MNLRRILVVHARLAGFVLLIECLTFWGWSRWFWTPIQARYMGAYLWSSLPGIPPASGLRIRWIWKTGPGGKRELAIEDDAVRVPSNEQDKTGMSLSQSAREAGWTGFAEGFPERLPIARLRSILSNQVFEGQTVWIFVLLPAMIGFAVAIFLLQCYVWLLDWLPEMPWRHQRFPWEDRAPTLFERGAALVRKTRAIIVRLGWTAIPGTRTLSKVLGTSTTEAAHPVKAASITLQPFGVCDGSSTRVYVWSETDEIE